MNKNVQKENGDEDDDDEGEAADMEGSAEFQFS